VVLWLLCLHGIVLLISWQLIDRVSCASWARSIKSGRLFQRPKSYHQAPNLPGTNTSVKDVLLLDEMRSEYLASLSHVLDSFHPGSRAFGNQVRNHCAGFSNLTPALQEQLCSSILRWNRQNGRRVLVKNQQNNWASAEQSRVRRFCHKEMMKESNPVVRAIINQVDFLLSETKFGYWRSTSMHKNHIPFFFTSCKTC